MSDQSRMRVISLGGGVQSTALCVLATQGKLGRVDAALFANVGDDSEHPATLRYVREVLTPWASAHGLGVHELHRTTKAGYIETLWGRLTKPGQRATTIPVRGENGAPQSRHCTVDFKVDVVWKWLREQGASKTKPARVLIGISTDEYHRATSKPSPGRVKEYPLIDMGISRDGCEQIIRDAGLPVPGKSSCFFCPWHSEQTWAEMRRDTPQLFAASAGLEAMMQARSAALGERPVYLTDKGARLRLPLHLAVAEAQTPLFTDGAFNEGRCDEGYCWT